MAGVLDAASVAVRELRGAAEKLRNAQCAAARHEGGAAPLPPGALGAPELGALANAVAGNAAKVEAEHTTAAGRAAKLEAVLRDVWAQTEALEQQKLDLERGVAELQKEKAALVAERDALSAAAHSAERRRRLLGEEVSDSLARAAQNVGQSAGEADALAQENAKLLDKLAALEVRVDRVQAEKEALALENARDRCDAFAAQRAKTELTGSLDEARRVAALERARAEEADRTIAGLRQELADANERIAAAGDTQAKADEAAELGKVLAAELAAERGRLAEAAEERASLQEQLAATAQARDDALAKVGELA